MTLGECNTCTTICVMSDVTMTCDAMYMYRDEVRYKYNVYIHTYIHTYNTKKVKIVMPAFEKTVYCTYVPVA